MWPRWFLGILLFVSMNMGSAQAGVLFNFQQLTQTDSEISFEMFGEVDDTDPYAYTTFNIVVSSVNGNPDLSAYNLSELFSVEALPARFNGGGQFSDVGIATITIADIVNDTGVVKGDGKVSFGILRIDTTRFPSGLNSIILSYDGQNSSGDFFLSRESTISFTSVAAVPEPTSLIIWGLVGSVALMYKRRRGKQPN